MFDRSTGELIVDLDSKVILEAHLQCAAHEIPLRVEDEQYFGASMEEICNTKLEKDKEGWLVARSIPAADDRSETRAGTMRTPDIYRILRNTSLSEVSKKKNIA